METLQACAIEALRTATPGETAAEERLHRQAEVLRSLAGRA